MNYLNKVSKSNSTHNLYDYSDIVIFIKYCNMDLYLILTQYRYKYNIRFIKSKLPLFVFTF